MIMPDLITIANGESPLPTFSGNEMNNRLSKLRQVLSDSRVDAAIFTSYHNINYYSDFLYCQFGRLYGLVVDESNQTTITANIDRGQPGRRTWGDNLVYTDWKQDNWFKAVKERVAGAKTVGVEFDHLSVRNLDKLKAALPESEIIDISTAVMRLKMIKSDEEIAHITKMAAIADLGGAACVEAIDVGVPEYEVAYIQRKPWCGKLPEPGPMES